MPGNEHFNDLGRRYTMAAQGMQLGAYATGVTFEEFKGRAPIVRGDPRQIEAAVQQLGVARNTVALAYELLVNEGYLLTRSRSGHYVNPEIAGGAPIFPELAGGPCPAAASASASSRR